MPTDPTQPYDDSNIFAKILRGELPCKKVYEDEWVLAFEDIGPQAPVHVLVIPKNSYVSLDDFTKNAPGEEIAGFFSAVGEIGRQLGLVEPGYRVLTNIGFDGGQEVPHFHVHVCGGKPLGRLIAS